MKNVQDPQKKLVVKLELTEMKQENKKLKKKTSVKTTGRLNI